MSRHDRMAVKVRDHAAEAAHWGRGHGGPVTRTVTIAAHCPRCGVRRGTPTSIRQVDDGEHYGVDTWKNPCGHIDMYHDVVAEAATLAAADARRAAWVDLLVLHVRERGGACSCGHRCASVVDHLDHLAVLIDQAVLAGAAG